MVQMMLFLILIPTNSWAEEAVHLNKSQSAPYEGILLTVSKAEQTKVRLIEADQLTDINTSLNKSLDLYKTNEILYNNKINLLMTQNDTLAKSAYEAQSNSFWKYAIMFLGGCAATTLGLYGLKQLQK